jgi:hypothetical protein
MAVLGRTGGVWRATGGAVRPELALALAVFLVIAVLAGAGAVAWLKGVRQVDSMFEAGQAQRAFAAVTQRTGPSLGVRTLEITPREMTVRGTDPKLSPWVEIPATGSRPAHTEFDPAADQANWRVSHWSFFGLYDWYPVSGPTRDGNPAQDRANSFRLQPADIPDLAQLAKEAKQRAGSGGSVASMTLTEKQVIVRLSGQPGNSEFAFERHKPASDKPVPAAPAPPASERTVTAVAPPAPPPMPQNPVAPVAPSAPPKDDPGIAEAVKRALERNTAPPPAPASQVTVFEAMTKADEARARRDYPEAVRWDRTAAELGSREAQLNLGIAYDKGEGVPQDYDQALHWSRMAADQGLAQAQSLVGVFYAEGRGVTQDYAAALGWYRKAADQDYSPAQLHLGTLYATGKGTPRDYAAALRWYRKAADQGEAAAQYDVGLIYFNGLDVPPDRREGRRWIEKAAAGGDDPARQWLKAH